MMNDKESDVELLLDDDDDNLPDTRIKKIVSVFWEKYTEYQHS